MPSGLEIVTKAMKIAGVIGQNETPTPSEATDGLASLNDMLESWSTKRSLIYAIEQETFNLVSGTASYTIGTSGTFNTDRPIKIDNIVINQGEQVYPLTPITPDAYANLSNKTTNGGIPEFYYIDNDYPLSTIYFYCEPQSGLTVTIGKWKALQVFANLTTSYTFAPGYRRAIHFNLAKEIASEYGVMLTAEAAKNAKDSFAFIRNNNLPARIMQSEITNLVNPTRSNNIYQG
jgi:hypothetical protein